MFDLSRLPLIETLEAQFDPQTGLVGSREAGTHIFRTLEFLVLLGQSEQWARLEFTLDAVLNLQISDETQDHFGWMPLTLSVQAPTWIDYNAPLFIAPYLLHVWENYDDHLAPARAARFQIALENLIRLGEARWNSELYEIWRDHVAYSNIFLLYVLLLLEAGRVLGDERRTQTGWGQWRRWFNHTSYFGVDEFASPTYGDIDYRALSRIEILANDENQRAEASSAKAHLGALQLALFHPKLGLQVSGSARDYRKWHDGSVQLPAPLRDANFADTAAREEWESRQFPFRARGRAGGMPFRFESYQLKNAALGSMSGGNYMWQQMHCIGAVGQNDNQRAVFWMPGRYTPTPGFVAQRDNRALCLFGRIPHAFHRTQWLLAPELVEKSFGDFGIGLSEGWKVEKTLSGLRLESYGWSAHIWPWILEEKAAVPAVLGSSRRTGFGQSMFHQTPADFVEWTWPRDARWFGCEVLLAPQEEPVATPQWNWNQKNSPGGGELQLQSSSGLEIRLWQGQGGEPVEVYERDARTLALFDSPAHTLWPGEFTSRALDARFGVFT